MTFEEYLHIQENDKTIRGQLHTHPRSHKFPDTPVMVSDNNLGFFLATGDILQICQGPQGDYLILLRTNQTPPPSEELGHEATKAYRELADLQTRTKILSDMDRKAAILDGTFEAMMVTPTSISTILFSSYLYNFLFTSVRVFLYFLVRLTLLWPPSMVPLMVGLISLLTVLVVRGYCAPVVECSPARHVEVITYQFPVLPSVI